VEFDLDIARSAFDASTDFTVGLEEEFAVLDPADLGLTARFEELREAANADLVLAASISGELISSEIEIRSGRGDDLAAAQAASTTGASRMDSNTWLGATTPSRSMST
jgi:carboxylate-amine ligase